MSVQTEMDGVFSDFEKLWKESNTHFEQVNTAIDALGDKMEAERTANEDQVQMLQGLIGEAATLVKSLIEQVQKERGLCPELEETTS